MALFRSISMVLGLLSLLCINTVAHASPSLEALYEKGFAYQKGRGVEIDPLTARDYYMDAANQGHWKAQYALGWMYLNGDGLTQDSAEAKKWLSMAAKQGDGRAQYALGQLLRTAPPPLGDQKQGLDWVQRAAKSGFAQAQYQLGMIYLQGNGVTVDTSQAWHWLTQAEKGGVHKAGEVLSHFSRFTIARAQQQQAQASPPQTTAPASPSPADQQAVTASALHANPAPIRLGENPTTLSYRVIPGPGGDLTRSVRLIYDAATGEAIPLYEAPKARSQGALVAWNRHFTHLQSTYDSVLQDPAADPRADQYVRRIQANLLAPDTLDKIKEAVELAVLTLESGGIFDPGWLATLTPALQPDDARQDVDQALLSLTELESPAAHYIYGMRLLARHALTQAQHHLQQSAELGFVHAQHALFEYYMNPTPNQSNRFQARYWGEQAASLGLVKSQIMLGFSLLSGSVLNQDLEGALHWLHQASKRFPAITVWDWTLNPAGRTFTESEPLLKQTIHWFQHNRYEQVTPANLLLAQFLNRAYTKDLEDTLATVVDGAQGTFKPITSRFTFERKLDDFIKAIWRAHHDDPVATQEAQQLYKQVISYPLPESYLEQLQQAASQENALAQTRWAFMHLMGLGVTPNRPMALYWFYRAARQGRHVEFATAQAYLSFLALQQPKNETRWFRALQWMNRAKDWDYIAAMQYLARFGFGKQVRTIKLPSATSEPRQGPYPNAHATLLAGLMRLPPLAQGDEALKGIELIQLAAQAEEPAALFFLGQLYLEGAHLAKNLDRATHLQLRALELGYHAAPLSYTELSLELLGNP